MRIRTQGSGKTSNLQGQPLRRVCTASPNRWLSSKGQQENLKVECARPREGRSAIYQLITGKNLGEAKPRGGAVRRLIPP